MCSSGSTLLDPMMTKMECLQKQFLNTTQMDPPQTRREKKKDQREKGGGKDGKYSQKHIRAAEALLEKKKKSK
jgi:hypothetical protein